SARRPGTSASHRRRPALRARVNTARVGGPRRRLRPSAENSGHPCGQEVPVPSHLRCQAPSVDKKFQTRHRSGARHSLWITGRLGGGESGRCAGSPLPTVEMRRTWDALAGAETAVYVGDPARGAEELAGLFGRLGADPRGGTCVEVGCGPGRMTGALAERFDRVLALDVSPAMLEPAPANVPAPDAAFRAGPAR